MSRIGKKPILLPAGVDFSVAGSTVTVKGPKGTLTRELHPHVSVSLKEEDGHKVVILHVADEERVRDRALWGLFRALLQNMVLGVTTGFEKKLEVIGVGYKVAGGGTKITLDVGYSHPVVVDLPAGITGTVEKNTITLSGNNNELLGETAARIRRIRKPEPYKGKGIKYTTEVIRRKAGKAAKAGAK